MFCLTDQLFLRKSVSAFHPRGATRRMGNWSEQTNCGYMRPMENKMPDISFGQLMQANELGVRLEIVGGLPIWESHPVLKHQRAVDRIRASIRAQEAVAGWVNSTYRRWAIDPSTSSGHGMSQDYKLNLWDGR